MTINDSGYHSETNSAVSVCKMTANHSFEQRQSDFGDAHNIPSDTTGSWNQIAFPAGEG